MHPLLTELAKWPGRQPTQAFLSTKGYALPDRYREIILSTLGRPDADDLDRYWDEVAREYLCTAGTARSNDRVFSGETAYRSTYLDGLAISARSGGITTPAISLHAGLRELFIEGNKPGNGLWPRIWRQMEDLKATEIQNLGISTSGWNGTKSDLTKLVSVTAEMKGFNLYKRKWQKRFGDALLFRCAIDTGMRSTWRFQLPLIFEIEHRAANDLVFSTWQLDYLIPGFRYYHQYSSPDAAALGIQAHIDLFDAIGKLVAD